MTSVTVRVLEGMGQGRVFANLGLPVSIGREDGNIVQLNDDQISRCHARIQEQAGRVIITDLESTNGTSVNGHAIHVRILQVGDVIKVGRCTLLFADRDDTKVKHASSEFDSERTMVGHEVLESSEDDDDLAFTPAEASIHEDSQPVFPNGRPELPIELNTLQRIQLNDLLAYFHERVGVVVKAGKDDAVPGESRHVDIDWDAWKKLVNLQVELLNCMETVFQRQASS